MSDIAIRVEGLGKQYRLGAQQAPYQTLGEQFRKWTSLRSLLRRQSRTEKNPPFWALKDVSFEVKKGEVVGIIGRNGAGKSTLLKILSQITEPTEGTVDLFGRVGSLLEVGTGFHPELTGRENIYLNGAILGMKRVEIARKFDEIVAFAEVEKFIDTAVKHYSSGMYMRLAFAVAAHLEPDILVVDEVLAVGDAEFQRKCLGKMGEVARTGRTVLFVSHHTSAVKTLCTRGLLLERGRLVRDGPADRVVDHYLGAGGEGAGRDREWEEGERPGTEHCRLVALRVRDADGSPRATFSSGRDIIVHIEFDVEQFSSTLCVGFALVNNDGVVVLQTHHNDRELDAAPRPREGRNRFLARIPAGLLNYGRYQVAPKVFLHGTAWVVRGSPELPFEVFLDHGREPFYVTMSDKFPGVIAPCLEWQAAPVVEGGVSWA